jgi:hypothetical protein
MFLNWQCIASVAWVMQNWLLDSIDIFSIHTEYHFMYIESHWVICSILPYSFLLVCSIPFSMNVAAVEYRDS